MGKCKDCKWASFSVDENGARAWNGSCLFYVISSNGKEMKHHDVAQHFNCSNGKFTKR